MPKTLKKQLKYKCGVAACGKLIRGDKWKQHCRSDHGYMFPGEDDIKKIVVAVEEGDNEWQPQLQAVTLHFPQKVTINSLRRGSKPYAPSVPSLC
jgi:hypothetical protein